MFETVLYTLCTI